MEEELQPVRYHFVEELYVDGSNETHTLTLTHKIQEQFIKAEQKHRIMLNTSYNEYRAHEHYFASSFRTLHHSFSLFSVNIYTIYYILYCYRVSLSLCFISVHNMEFH